jgi:hypothetical protein
VGTDFIQRAAKSFQRSWDRRRVELATASLLTQQPVCAARTAEADIANNARLAPGDSVTVQTAEGDLIAVRDLSVVAKFSNPPPALVEAVRSSCGIAKGTVEQVHYLAGVAEISVC